MKSTGIVRRIDELGRVVIPKELRGTLGISERDPLEIFVHEDKIILRKYRPGCFICGKELTPMRHFHGREICTECIQKAAELHVN